MKMIAGGAVCALLVFFAAPTYANAIWPPALYFYMFGVWWAVVGGLILEFLVHTFVLRMPWLAVARMVVASNITSALAGFVILWPAVFWEVGVTKLAAMMPFSIFAIFLAILLVNITIEYVFSVRWLNVARGRKALLSFALANIASYALILCIPIFDLVDEVSVPFG